MSTIARFGGRGVLAVALMLSGCSMKQMAAESTAEIMAEAGPSLQEEADPELAEAAITANLKMFEGLLRIIPENKPLLRLSAEAFSSYAFAFLQPKLWQIEDEFSEEAEHLAWRIKSFQARAGHYARRYLAAVHPALEASLDGPLDGTTALLGEVDDDDSEVIDAIFWTAHTWSLRIQADLDDLEAVASMPTVMAMMNKVVEVAPGHQHGMPLLFFGVSNVLTGPGLGGDLDAAEGFFDRAVALHDGRFLMARFMRGRYYCVARQDRACFERELDSVAEMDPDVLPEQRLVNTLAIRWSKLWRERADDLF